MQGVYNEHTCVCGTCLYQFLFAMLLQLYSCVFFFFRIVINEKLLHLAYLLYVFAPLFCVVDLLCTHVVLTLFVDKDTLHPLVHFVALFFPCWEVSHRANINFIITLSIAGPAHNQPCVSLYIEEYNSDGAGEVKLVLALEKLSQSPSLS